MRIFIGDKEKNVTSFPTKEEHVGIAASKRNAVDDENTINENDMTRAAQPDLLEIVKRSVQKLSEDTNPRTKKAKRRSRKPADE